PINVGMSNSHGLERGPALSDDGFTLYFASDRNTPGKSGLFRTRTREIIPAEGPHPAARDLSILAFLAAIALSSWLARRWKTLDVFYKCLVASFLIHVAFLWYS